MNDSYWKDRFRNLELAFVLLFVANTIGLALIYFFRNSKYAPLVTKFAKSLAMTWVTCFVGVLVLVLLMAKDPVIDFVIFCGIAALFARWWYNRSIVKQNVVTEKPATLQDAIAIGTRKNFVKKYLNEYDWHFFSYEKRRDFYNWLAGHQVDPETFKVLVFGDEQNEIDFVEKYDDYDRMALVQQYCTRKKMCWIDEFKTPEEKAKAIKEMNRPPRVVMWGGRKKEPKPLTEQEKLDLAAEEKAKRAAKDRARAEYRANRYKKYLS